MQSRNFWLSREVILGLAFGILLVVPVFVFGGSQTIYVDKDASGSENGTVARPYHSISKALKNADGGTEVRVKNGTYKENITIPKGVDVVGDSKKRDKVVIESDNDDKPTVTMKHDTALSHVTVKGGRHGVRILEDAKAHIFDAVIKKSQRDGIHIDSAPRDKKHRVLIDKTKISDNDRAGIFAEKRFIVLINSDILSNGSDGIDLAAGTKAWFENNRFNDNKGSGAKLTLDGASIFSKKNSFRNNKREGIEVSAYGAAGTIELKRAAFVDNDRYGVARVARTVAGTRMFGNLSFGIGINASRFEANSLGNLSSIIRGF
ncbi:MAG: right-handed parallel beta-helix repeat-containing protein [bacterium]|nr:right-handed parallel beta-helix repeat-containing protein [bacterium]